MKRIYTMLFVVCALTLNAQFFTEDFENGLPTGWTIDGEFNLTDATTINSLYFQPAEHSTFVGVNDDGLGQGVDGDASLTTGVIDLTAATGTLVLTMESFFINGDYQGNDETAKVFVSTDGGTTWDEIWNITDAGTAWQKIGILFDYAGQEVMIRFEYDDADTWNYGWCFDDISIEQAPGRDVSFSSWNQEAFFDGGFEGGKVYPGANVKNEGTDIINSVDLTWSDGTNTNTTTFDNLNLGFGQSAFLQINDPYIIPAADVSLSISVGNANGMGDDENLTNDAGADLAIAVVTPNPDRGVLVEEGTGTWCQFCPRGDIFMNGLASRYPGNFVGVAVHNGDPMTVDDYDGSGNPQDPNDDYNFALLIGGYPSGTIERSAETDPSQFEGPFVTAVQQAPPAKLNVGADFNEATRELTISVDAEMMEALSGEHKLGVILVENGVTGTGSGYAQVNAYSGNGPMGIYEFLPTTVPAADMVYNHVGVALIGGFDGAAGSLPATVAVGERHGYTFDTYTVPNSVNLDELHIAGVLFNASNIPVNAIEVSLDEAIAEGIFVATEDVFNHEAVSVAPNPFKGSTYVQLSLESSQDVTIEVFNAVGQSVSRMEYGELVGTQNLKIDATNFESGVYFVHVKMGDKLATKRVTVSK